MDTPDTPTPDMPPPTTPLADAAIAGNGVPMVDVAEALDLIATVLTPPPAE